MKASKDRLDLILVARGLADSRQLAQALILAGRVRKGSRIFDKAGQKLPTDIELTLVGKEPFVSRGGKKLARALDIFSRANMMPEPRGMTCLDVGSSTGGFTDCLLQRGAKEVWAVDVGYGQIHQKLRESPQVKLFEKCNFRYFHEKIEKIAFDLIVTDVSFISLAKLLKPFDYFSNEQTRWVFLIKPQFEAGRDRVGRNGVIKDAGTHIEVIFAIQKHFLESGRVLHALGFSPIKGPKGNIEFVALFLSPTESQSLDSQPVSREGIEMVVDEAHQTSF